MPSERLIMSLGEVVRESLMSDGKQSTKKCPICANENLVLFRSVREKACINNEHGLLFFSWNLDEGQLPLDAGSRMKRVKRED